MSVTTEVHGVPVQAGAFYRDNGYVIARGLFSPGEVERYREHYLTLRRHGAYPGDFSGVEATSADPLKRYPRMIHMHRWDETSLRCCWTPVSTRGSPGCWA